jgi:hypothetical protein
MNRGHEAPGFGITMQVHLKRTSRGPLVGAGLVVFLVGLAAVFCGAIFSPEFVWLAKLGVWAIEGGILLIVITAVTTLVVRNIPRWRRMGGRYLEVDFTCNPQVHCGDKFTWEISFTPRQRILIKRCSVTLVGVHEWQGKWELEGDRIFELTSTLSPYTRFPRNTPVKFNGTLFVPDDAPPSFKQDDDETRWFLEISLRSFWRGFTGLVPLNVTSTRLARTSSEIHAEWASPDGL